MFAKVRIAKTRLQWKKELDTCKYITGTSTLPVINKFQLFCGRETPMATPCANWKVCVQLRQFVVSRTHATFAEVTESVKTYQELIEVDSVTHMFKNMLFNDVNYTLCNVSHKSLDCLSLRSIIEMEVSSSCSPNSSSSDSRSWSPNRDYYGRRKRYLQRSRSSSRSPGRYDAQSASYDNRDNRNQSPYRNSYYHYRQYSPNYQDRKNNNPNGFSPVRNCNRNRYPNDSREWLYQRRYQGPSQPNFQTRPNNAGNTWNQGPPKD